MITTILTANIMAQTQPIATIYIGYAFMMTDKKTTKEFVKNKFEEILGDKDSIMRVDIVEKHDSKADRKYISMYVHIAEWPKNENSKKLQSKMKKDKDFKIQYSERYYWKCLPSKLEMPTFEKKKFGLAHIVDSDSDSDSDSE